ncbi:inositol monophosphatase family protein [Gryllotalpicola reticulitermitis]|uniref:Inositol monophosphatase family protein n=1 Tax=Gryllotalpicola reticulitermitis TaxID=1184153 RepID=A0ABV8Q642_9MICO
MTAPAATFFSGANPRLAHDQALIPGVVAALIEAGNVLVARFETKPEFRERGDVLRAISDNDTASLSVMRPALEALHPKAGWAEDELDSGTLDAGEWWVTDPVEGNINHIHGMPEWGVTATLVRDNVPVLTAVHLPLSGDSYTAVLGGGAFLNGQPITPSTKTRLDAALAGTGQASPRETAETFVKIGRSTEAMLTAALVLRVSVPATLQLVQVAAGRMDLFWQHSAVRSGLVSGALLVGEAGGVITDIHGQPWTLESSDFLATAPALHDEAVSVLSPTA